MRQEQRSWRSEQGSRLWLSMLVGAMEDRGVPPSGQDAVDTSAQEQLQLQLALPASPSYPISKFSFNN